MEDLKSTITKSTSLTPLTFLERASLVYGESPSIIYNATTYTWSQTNCRCLRAASAISALGIGRNDIVSVVAPNVPAAYELHFAVPMAGAVLNNINTRLNPANIATLLHHSESKLVFVDYQFSSLVLEALSLLTASHHRRPLLVLIANEDDKTSLITNFCATYEDLIQRGDPNFKWVPPASEWDPIVVNYTSGTTSCPKGVVHCHRGTYISALDSLMDWSVPKQPVYLWTLPMFHVNGWSFTWGMAAVGGINICLRQVDCAKTYDLINCHRVTHMCAAPVVLNMLINHSSVARQTLHNPVHVLTAGAPPPASIILRAEELGFVVAHGYGLTETGGVVVSCVWKRKWNQLPAMEKARLRARQGLGTLGMTAIDVVDPTTNKSVNRDGKTIGEIVMKGNTIMLGYLKNPRETSKCMGEDGWFRTGDLGVMHEDGYLEIKDRSKDIIISGGENISSVEVESVLYTFPGVNEAAVVAQPHEFWGETPCAFVCFKSEVEVKPTKKEIIEFCRARLAHYMVPKQVVFKDKLPKTSTGKIQKFVLKEEAKAMITGPAKTSRL